MHDDVDRLIDRHFGPEVSCGTNDVNSLRIDPPNCCNKKLELDTSGVRVCFECGKVEHNVWRSYATPLSDYTGSGKRCSLSQAKRLSKPLHNFRRVLRQFFGNLADRDMAPTWLMNKFKRLKWIDLKDRDIYAKIREWMRSKPSLRKYYKNIFELIYSCGGQQPYDASRCIPRLEAEYSAMCYHFDQTICDKQGRTSMFNVWMVLQHLLKRFRCESYYTLPVVKDKKANARITAFIDSYSEFARTRGGIDLDKEYEATGVWVVGLPCINYFNNYNHNKS
jgi:hypothetical protein